MKLKRLVFLSFGHLASDFYPGMLSPLLPLIIDRHGLSMAHAGLLVTVLQGFCNLSQPFVGVLNDYRPMKFFLWTGLIISGLPFCFLMQADSLNKMIIALAISGIGVGMYHPVAAVAAGLNARGEHKSLSMAVFSSGGTIGFLTAPLFVVLVVKTLGEQYMPLAIVPALLMAVYFVSDRDIVVSEKHHLTSSEWFASLVENKRELAVLWLVSSFRAVVHLLVGSFLPLLIINRGSSYESSAFILSATLFAGMIGMFMGGHLSDIHGRRKVMAITLFVASPLLYAFLHTSGIVSIILLLMGMGALTSTIPVNIILAQRAAPKHAGTASSLVMGLSFAVSALAATPFGMLADVIGIEAAMRIVFALPVIGGFSVFFLRKE